MKCNNPYCPVAFDAFKEPCLDCEHRVKSDDEVKYDLPPGWENIFGGKK